MSVLKSLRLEEIEQYKNNGFSKVAKKIFTVSDFCDLSSCISKILDANGNKEASTAVGYLHLRYPEILFWLLSDNILDICEDILGPNIGLYGSTIFYKKANTPDKAHWHTDTSGLVRFNLIEDKNMLNLTLALTQVDKHNGCLRYYPGTHLKHFEHDWLATANNLITNPVSISEERLRDMETTFLELSENEASAHNVNVVHGSEPNLSTRDRITLSIRFFSASARCNIENFKKNNILPLPFLVRGQDITNSQIPVLKIK